MLKLVVRQGMLLAGIGVVIGLAASFGLNRFLGTLLFGVKATDPITYAAVAMILISVALLATYIPARRATRDRSHDCVTLRIRDVPRMNADKHRSAFICVYLWLAITSVRTRITQLRSRYRSHRL